MPETEKIRRTCFSCVHLKVCVLRISFTENSKYLRMNIDTNDSPKNISNVYETIAGACLEYKNSHK